MNKLTTLVFEILKEHGFDDFSFFKNAQINKNTLVKLALETTLDFSKLSDVYSKIVNSNTDEEQKISLINDLISSKDTKQKIMLFIFENKNEIINGLSKKSPIFGSLQKDSKDEIFSEAAIMFLTQTESKTNFTNYAINKGLNEKLSLELLIQKGVSSTAISLAGKLLNKNTHVSLDEPILDDKQNRADYLQAPTQTDATDAEGESLNDRFINFINLIKEEKSLDQDAYKARMNKISPYLSELSTIVDKSENSNDAAEYAKLEAEFDEIFNKATEELVKYTTKKPTETTNYNLMSDDELKSSIDSKFILANDILVKWTNDLTASTWKVTTDRLTKYVEYGKTLLAYLQTKNLQSVSRKELVDMNYALDSYIKSNGTPRGTESKLKKQDKVLNKSVENTSIEEAEIELERILPQYVDNILTMYQSGIYPQGISGSFPSVPMVNIMKTFREGLMSMEDIEHFVSGDQEKINSLSPSQIAAPLSLIIALKAYVHKNFYRHKGLQVENNLRKLIQEFLEKEIKNPKYGQVEGQEELSERQLQIKQEVERRFNKDIDTAIQTISRLATAGRIRQLIEQNPLRNPEEIVNQIFTEMYFNGSMPFYRAMKTDVTRSQYGATTLPANILSDAMQFEKKLKSILMYEVLQAKARLQQQDNLASEYNPRQEIFYQLDPASGETVYYDKALSGEKRKKPNDQA